MALLVVPSCILMAFIVLVGLYSYGFTRSNDDGGSIELAGVSLIQDRGRMYLDARADVDLPVTIRAGLDNGVPLVFVLVLRFFQPSDFWFDKELESLEYRFSLTYYELTRHYRVQSIGGKASRNYRSLSSALRGLGTIERLPLYGDASSTILAEVAKEEQAGNKTTFASLDLRLDSQSLPLPLQPVITSRWRLASKEVLWPVN